MPEAVWAVVVARVGHGAKSRLADVLDPGQRRDLALAMLADVVGVCAASGLAGTVAVVDDTRAATIVRRSGAVALLDPVANDMNAAARSGVRFAAARDASTVIVVPGDVPLISRSDLETLLAQASEAERVVLVGASADGQGTNALLLRPPSVIAPAFGPPSVERHLRLGRAAGARAQALSGLQLSLDVDTPADLDALSDRPVPAHTSAFLTTLRCASLSSI
jgi:2-phospho-L-lactate guanylyltransferase